MPLAAVAFVPVPPDRCSWLGGVSWNSCLGCRAADGRMSAPNRARCRAWSRPQSALNEIGGSPVTRFLLGRCSSFGCPQSTVSYDAFPAGDRFLTRTHSPTFANGANVLPKGASAIVRSRSWPFRAKNVESRPTAPRSSQDSGRACRSARTAGSRAHASHVPELQDVPRPRDRTASHPGAVALSV